MVMEQAKGQDLVVVTTGAPARPQNSSQAPEQQQGPPDLHIAGIGANSRGLSLNRALGPGKV